MSSFCKWQKAHKEICDCLVMYSVGDSSIPKSSSCEMSANNISGMRNNGRTHSNDGFKLTFLRVKHLRSKYL